MNRCTEEKNACPTKSGHGHGPILLIKDLNPSPENDRVYKPIDPNDPELRSLAADIEVNGILEPLIITLDRYVLSGHRRPLRDQRSNACWRELKKIRASRPLPRLSSETGAAPKRKRL